MRNRIIFTLALGLGLVSAGCASLQKSATDAPIKEVTVTPPEEGYQPSAEFGHVETPINPSVDKWINYFTGRGRKYMQVYLERSSRYIPMMKGVFRERGMPEELVYIALIESGFSPTAFSHASAVGYWQFIRDTGKRYNLKIDPYVDERRDPILSTQAAASYLGTLYGMMGDWYLALGSYNAGENRIMKAVRNRKTRNFWELAAMRRALPRETANYIPKFIAAVHIARDPAKYGFTNIDFHPEFEFESVTITKPVSLELLATAMNIPYEDLKKMNPRYKSDYVPVYSDRQNAVRVPVGQTANALLAMEKSYSEAPRRYIASFDFYKVRRGDTLSGIARKFRTSIARIRDLNDWQGRKTFIKIGQRIKVPEDGPMNAKLDTQKPTVSETEVANNSERDPDSVGLIAGAFYVVRRGDTLISIASRHGISLGDIRRLNNLQNRSKVRVGERLVVQKTSSAANMHRAAGLARASAASVKSATRSALNSSDELAKIANAQRSKSAKTSKVASISSAKKHHVVKVGENLTTIAKQYGVTVGDIAKTNALNNRAKLFVGRSLLIPR